MSRNAAILGATGLIGSHLLDILLDDNSYDGIWVYGRNSTGRSHPRLRENIGNLLDEHYFKKPISAEDIYCCIGTTQSKTPDMAEYRQIDYGIPVRAAQAGIKGGMHKFLVVSSLGANAGSTIFYPKTKGQMEDALQKMAIPRLHIFRPSMLLGERDEFRMGEKIGAVIMKAFDWAIPAKYKGIAAGDVARAMHKVAKSTTDKEVFESHEIRALLNAAHKDAI